jgi:hypothetical protein
MSDTLAHSKSAKQTPSIQEKPKDLSAADLQLVAERLALICGHLGKMPKSVISGARVMNGFLLVALKIEGHELSVVSGVWKIDGQDVETFPPLTDDPVERKG